MEAWKYKDMKVGSGYLRYIEYVCGECFVCIWLFRKSYWGALEWKVRCIR